MRVLVVEDELRLAENIATALREGPGCAVDLCHNGVESLELCAAVEYDLVVLDLMIPQLSGAEVVRTLRHRNDATPILILTAVHDKMSTVKLLNLGADDYMTKPFDLGEFLARARALIRRGKGLRQTQLTVGDVTLSVDEMKVVAAGNIVELSPTEYRILEFLMHHPRRVISRQALLEHLYDFTWEHHSNVIEAHVSNLRRKLKAASASTSIDNLRGRGYKLTAGEGE